MTLRGLIEAVSEGTATTNDFDAAFPPDGKPFKNAPQSITSIDAGLAFQGSLDAAKRLHDALLPGWTWGVTSQDEEYKRPAAFVAHPDNDDIGHEASADNVARAFLLAILRALEGEP